MKAFITKYKYYLIGAIISLSVIGLDQLTKWLTRLYLPNQYGPFTEPALKIIPGFFHLVEHHNYGVSWSSFENNVFIFICRSDHCLNCFWFFYQSRL